MIIISDEIQSSSSDLDIKIGVGLEDYKTVASKVSDLLSKLEKNYEFRLKVNTSAINDMKEAQKAIKEMEKSSKNANKNIEESLSNVGRGYTSIVKEMKKIHGDKGLVKITEFGKGTKSLDKFTVEIKKAGGEVEKLKYKYDALQKGFTFEGKTVVDNTHVDRAKRIAEIEDLKAKSKKLIADLGQTVSADTLANPKIVTQIENIKKSFVGLRDVVGNEFTKRMNAIKESFTDLTKSAKSIDGDSTKKQKEVEAETKAWEKIDIAQRKAILNYKKLEQQNPKPFSFDEVSREAELYLKRLQAINNLPLDKAEKEVKELEVSWKSLQNKVSGVAAQHGRTDSSWLSSVTDGTKKFFQWYVSANLITQTKEAISSAIREIGAMDTATVELTKVTDMSEESLRDMQQTAKSLGKEMGKLAPSIMESMAEFGRITKDAELIKELTKTSVLGSNVTSMSPDEMAKAINTTVLSMNLELRDSMMILDQFNSIQNSFRTNAEDLAESISAVGSAATQVGIPLEKLNGYTTALVSSLGIGGDEVGTAIKSMISRVYRIGDEGKDGKAEEMLKSLGIQVKNLSTGELVDFDTILNQVSNRWGDFTESQQMAIAQAIGG